MKRICTLLLALFATSAAAEEQWTNIYDATLCESIINYDLVFNENSDFEEFQRKFDAKDAYSKFVIANYDNTAKYLFDVTQATREYERILSRNYAGLDSPCLLYTSPSPRDS